ncbi:MAG: UbiD family decarboxylase [Planctomycetaceae bacterium]|nr:UbiD family decarboxylase [Planctomycetaceae bacterium]
MGYRNLQQCVADLERHGHLIRIVEEIDPNLEAAEIQRRLYQAQGPAILFENVKGTRFPMVTNLFGTFERTEFLFRDALSAVQKLVALKIDPMQYAKRPWKYLSAVCPALSMLPRKVRSGPAIDCSTKLSELPQQVSWPDDGGPFVTLPAVYTEDPRKPGLMSSNLGMYRVQLAGNDYEPDQEVGLHYQIHRSIGVHHKAAIERGKPLKVNIFIGGAPSMILSAVMPLPEGMSELTFAGALQKRAIRMISRPGGPAIYAEADFCISGTIAPDGLKPEGPFGDHLGYYSLQHPFPYLKVDQVYHRRNAIWPMTAVGRPPQEDTSFGHIIHEITGPAIPTVINGVKAVNAVDAAGVHPLLLAIGSERYVPYDKPTRPQELLTQANAILGQGQLSLAKYLLILNDADHPGLNIEEIDRFLMRLLERVDWQHDLHFQTRTTIDTLDYSGDGFNAGSKLVIAAVGPKRRELPKEIPSGLSFPDGFDDARVCLPGILAVRGPKFTHYGDQQEASLARFCESFSIDHSVNQFPIIVLVDDAEFTSATLNNFLWVTFTRSNPAADISGIGAFTHQKHFGCRGSLVIDARLKPHHAPPLIEDPDISRRVDDLAAPGKPLHGLF